MVDAPHKMAGAAIVTRPFYEAGRNDNNTQH
jgi:hypothetical protein